MEKKQAGHPTKHRKFFKNHQRAFRILPWAENIMVGRYNLATKSVGLCRHQSSCLLGLCPPWASHHFAHRRRGGSDCAGTSAAATQPLLLPRLSANNRYDHWHCNHHHYNFIIFAPWQSFQIYLVISWLFHRGFTILNRPICFAAIGKCPQPLQYRVSVRKTQCSKPLCLGSASKTATKFLYRIFCQAL